MNANQAVEMWHTRETVDALQPWEVAEMLDALTMRIEELEAAQQGVQSDGAKLQFCEICQSWHGDQHITTRDVSPRR